MNTRRKVDNSLLEVSDPERIIRAGHRASMAAQHDNRDKLEGEPEPPRVPENEEEEEPNVGRPNLFIPDLNNTHLADALVNGMALDERKTKYMICCPRLKTHIGVDTLIVNLPNGELEVPTDPPVRFIADCAPTPFDQPNLLITAMKGLREKHAELTPLPGDELHWISNRYLTWLELLQRLGYYIDLSVKYGECVLKYQSAQLLLDIDEWHTQELNQEILMHRISNILDKLTNTILKDNAFRKKNKKVTYPAPKLNPRSTTITSLDQLHEMKTALEDEIKGIIQIAFIEETEGEDRIALLPGENIPDDTGRKPNQTSTTNTRVAQPTWPTQPTQPTVNFDVWE